MKLTVTEKKILKEVLKLSIEQNIELLKDHAVFSHFDWLKF